MKKTNIGLVNYAQAQLGKPYWYGTFGQKSTKSLYEQKKKQYPNYYTSTSFSSEYGQKVHDCIGLIKGYIWSKSKNDMYPKYASNGCPDINEEQMYNDAENKGDISTMPKEKGILVFKPNHVGVYIGDGKVIEARGHDYGVIKSSLKDRGFTKWCECPYITYKKTTENVKPTNDKIQVKTNGSDLNCREKPDINSKIKGLFANGTMLTIMEKTNKNWYKVKGKTTQNKTIIGYCRSTWLKKR